MRVAITGGLGFIGSHLAEAFARLGEAVSIIDDGSGQVEGVQAVGDDYHIMDAAKWARDIRWAQAMGMPDLVVHCAAPVGPGLVSGMGGRIATDIIRVTADVGNACAWNGIPLVNISSSEVYGVMPYEYIVGQPSDEKWPVGHDGVYTARSEYGLAKALAENVLANIDGLAHANVRPFNTAGPRQAASKGFVLPTFIEQAKRHEPLTVYEPRAWRSFTSVHDVVRFVVAYWQDAVAQGGAWNVGSMDNAVTIGELAQLVCNTHIAATGTDAKWVDTNPTDRWGEAYAFFGSKNGTKLPDSRKAMALGWQPQWILGDIVRDAYERTSL